MKNWNTVEPDQVMLLNKHFTKGRGGKKIDRIVIHHNAGNLTIKGCWQVWQTRPASAHYQVESSGRIGQLVWDRDTAWHAANSDINQRSIGIEHANSGSPTSTIGVKALEEGAHLTAALCKFYGLGRPQWGKNVFGHSHFTSTSCPGTLATTQRETYMARAGYWYDQMTHPAAPAKPAAEPTVDQLARDTIAGKYGNGPTRRARLGARYAAVQQRVNQLLSRR